MTDAMRAALTEAAIKAARTIGYAGAGTVEFIADASGGLRPDRFWFTGMNTRLDAGHPATEMATGIDLIEWQLRVAAGEKLPRTQDQIALSGHAIAASVCAEEPAREFAAATGTLRHVKFPEAGPALRLDRGIRAGDTVTPFYDPVIARLVVSEKDRLSAVQALSSALAATEIAGVPANVGFLAALSRDADFVSGAVDAGMIARKQDTLMTSPAPSPDVVATALLAASGMDCLPCDDDPWSSIAGYAHFHPMERQASVRSGDAAISAHVSARSDGSRLIRIEGERQQRVVKAAHTHPTALWPGHVAVFSQGIVHEFAVPDPFASPPVVGSAGQADTGMRPVQTEEQSDVGPEVNMAPELQSPLLAADTAHIPPGPLADPIDGQADQTG